MKFRKKPVVIEATQWFKNGDHPKDACKMVHPSPDSTTQFAPFLSEGKVVRYYRTPDLDGSRVCEQCENVMHDHGWIDTLERGHVVCPGDWIITGVKGERYPCKPDIFAATYEPVPDDAPSTPQADAEPAVWVQSNHLDEAKRNVFMARLAPRQVHPDYVPLYTHPAPNEPQAEPKREPLSDEQVTKGEYVLATKFGDGDPGDHWGVGFYDRFANGRHYVVDSAGKQIRGNGFRRVGRITVDVGRWLLSAGRSLEASPPGTVNLWTMLTERAHRIGGTDPALDDLQAKERA